MADDLGSLKGEGAIGLRGITPRLLLPLLLLFVRTRLPLLLLLLLLSCRWGLLSGIPLLLLLLGGVLVGLWVLLRYRLGLLRGVPLLLPVWGVAVFVRVLRCCR